jgi:hypothetical protein
MASLPVTHNKGDYMKSYSIIAYSWDAALHCPNCTYKYFSVNCPEHLETLEDSEGNPINPVFASDDLTELDCCDDCGLPLLEFS